MAHKREKSVKGLFAAMEGMQYLQGMQNRVHRSRGEFAKVIKSIRYAQENWVSTMLNTNITFILAKNDGNHVAF